MAKTSDIIDSLKICANEKTDCSGCIYEKGNDPKCYNQLKLRSVVELEYLVSENRFLRREKDERNH